MSDRDECDERDELYVVDVDALLDLAADMRRDAELGFIVWGKERLAKAAYEIEGAVGIEAMG